MNGRCPIAYAFDGLGLPPCTHGHDGADTATAEDRGETRLEDAGDLARDHAGARNAEATEILGSERMSSLLASLAAEPRRIVLIDSPPLLLTSEAGVIVAFAGQVVLVVKASSTPQEAVLRAIAVVPEEKSMRVVLNQAESVHGHQYGYYGGYAYDGTYGRAAAGPAVQDDRG